MATSEEEIRKGVILLLEKYGSLSTREVKRLLDTVMPFDEDDLERSTTRNEPLILQRIGNVVSHQTETIKIYHDSYQIDKSKRPAVWSILRGLKSNNTLREISESEIKLKNKQRSFVPKKIDWESLNNSKTELGYKGECFVVRYETSRVLNFAPSDLERIVHLSVEQGDGAGFDVLSLNEDGSSRYIEVKTTKLGFETAFYMSENERQFFEGNENAFIYRVYDFDEIKQIGKIKIISSNELFRDYNFDPINYQVTRK